MDGRSLRSGQRCTRYQLGVGVLCAIAVVMFLCCFSGFVNGCRSPQWGNLPCANTCRAAEQRPTAADAGHVFPAINVFNIRGGGYMYFITYVLQAVRATRRCSSPWSPSPPLSVGDCQPVNAAFRYRQNLLLHNLLLAALAVLMWFLPSGPAYKRCGWR